MRLERSWVGTEMFPTLNSSPESICMGPGECASGHIRRKSEPSRPIWPSILNRGPRISFAKKLGGAGNIAFHRASRYGIQLRFAPEEPAHANPNPRRHDKVFGLKPFWQSKPRASF